MTKHRAFGLSKSRIGAYHQCEKRLWLEVHRRDLRDDSAGAKRSFETGHHVGDLARQEYPDGVLIGSDDNLAQALQDTALALAITPRVPIFEATFQFDGVLVRADLMLPVAKGWHMAEVKSSTSVKDYHYPDLAAQTWVVRSCGVNVPSMELRHIDNSFVYPGGGEYKGLFISCSVQEHVESLLPFVPNWIADARRILNGPDPEIAMGDQCENPFACPFIGHCEGLAGPQTEYPVTLLPGAKGKKLAADLSAEGYRDLRDVPSRLLPDGVLATIHEATTSGTTFFDRHLAAELVQPMEFPRYYIDFETINLAIPIWEGTRPYQQVPFQWSCHIETARGEFTHRGFLDVSGNDPSIGCARLLLETVGDRGSLIAYSAGFEKSVIAGLAERLPSFASQLLALEERFFDPLSVIRQTYYHRDMRGSRSIKSVLPTIAPELDYSELGDVQDGGAAQAAFIEVTTPGVSRERREAITNALLDYCRRDTWAMVVIVAFLEGRLESLPSNQ